MDPRPLHMSTRDINDEVIQATGKLSPYQQFMLLRHLAVKGENDKSINTMTFEYKQANAPLTSSQKALLGQIENLSFPFEGIKQLKELRRRTGVTVVIADNAHLVKVLQDSIKTIKEQFKKFFEESSKDAKYGRRIHNETEEILYRRRIWAEKQLNPNGSTLLGLYSRKLLWFDDAKPTVFLFADNIRDYAKSNRCNEDNVFGYVFIHEMMHAYYDAFENKGFPSREPLEEAFAEYGMLTFINKNNSSLPGDLLADACKHVESKIQSGPSEYGFGFDLFKITSGGDVDLINLYMRKSNKIDLEVIKNWKSGNNYFEDIANYPKPVDADKCFKGVKEILYYDWKEPCFIIQPSIRGSLSTSVSPTGSKHGPFPVMPRLHRTIEWAVTASKIDWHFQYPLMKSDDLEQLLVQVLAVMKNEGFESYLSFSGDKIMFLGRLFSYYAATATEPNTLAESLNVKGNVVYPVFKVRLTGGPAGQVGNILYALGTLLDGTFTLAHEGAEFVLYGPGRCFDLFSTNTKSSSLSVSPSAVVSPKVKYQIIDKATSRVLNNENSMAKAALFIVKDFCSKNPGITLVDLQKLFSSVLSHTAPDINIIESDGNVMAYKKKHPADKLMRFLEKDPITLADGTVILVSNQWAANGVKENFSAFKKVAEDLGYIIK